MTASQFSIAMCVWSYLFWDHRIIKLFSFSHFLFLHCICIARSHTLLSQTHLWLLHFWLHFSLPSCLSSPLKHPRFRPLHTLLVMITVLFYQFNFLSTGLLFISSSIVFDIVLIEVVSNLMNYGIRIFQAQIFSVVYDLHSLRIVAPSLLLGLTMLVFAATVFYVVARSLEEHLLGLFDIDPIIIFLLIIILIFIFFLDAVKDVNCT